MNWTAVADTLDEIVKLRNELAARFSLRHPTRLPMDQSTQVIEAIAAALRVGLRTPCKDAKSS